MVGKARACTSVLVGRAATRDGSVIIARNEDNVTPCDPKTFRVVSAGALDSQSFVSGANGFRMELPAASLRYTAMPDITPSEGLFEEAGINSAHVAMSATESAYANDIVLGYDPYVENGIAEDAMLTVVLPWIRSAREGVIRLGRIVEEQGSAEANGVLFADSREAWYMEIATGHHWVAQRIPDDCYAVVANQISIQEVDFQSDGFLWSSGIREFVDAHALNPHPGSFDFRKIFGTASEQDIHYNTPRVWYGQKLLTPSVEQHPESFDLPFIRKPERKLGVEDVAEVLASHYQGTPYDPLGTEGDNRSRHRYRAIALSRTQESHILQMPADDALPICWLSVATPRFSPFMPLFVDVESWPDALDGATATPSLDNAYWLFRSLEALSDARFGITSRLVDAYSSEQRRRAVAHAATVGQAARGMAEEKRSAYLAQANERLVASVMADTREQLGELMKALAYASPLSFTMDANL